MSGPRLIVLPFLLAALAPGAVAAPPGLDLTLQAVSFPGPTSEAITRLYLEVSAPAVPADTLDLRIELEVEGEDGVALGGGDWIVPGVPGRGAPFRRVFPVRCPPGHGHARVHVEDLRTETAAEARIRFTVPRFDPGGLAVSEIVLGEAGAAPDTAVFPVPRKVYGPERAVLAAAIEIRDGLTGDPSAGYRLRLRIRDRRETRQDRAWEVPRRDGAGRTGVAEPVGDLPPGEYRLEFEVTLGKRRATADTWFEVGESGSTLRSDPERLRTVLGYVSTFRERIRLEEAPDDSLLAVWRGFWARRDPSPGTERNESEEEFLARVEEAERRFGGLDPGWRSDMGRIYIRFGPPDRIERFEDGLFGARTEVWTYVHRNATFTFQDIGYGRYRLAGER